MKLLRFMTKEISPCFGWIDQDMVGKIEGNPFGEYRRLDAKYQLTSVKILPPCEPTKIICIGRNYEAHANEHNAEIPEIPLLFLKPPSALISAGENIIIPPQSNKVEHEAELAVIIKKPGRWIQTQEAFDFILGHTIANDVTARDLQRQDTQWTRGKGFDTFCPLGPWMETEFDSSDALITCHVNGELRQMASTRDMVFTINQIISFASSVMTLNPGDVLLTGTPSGVGALLPGDNVSINIEGIGSLTNSVIAAPQVNSEE
ncbi:MAG: fumarylacetoacetate hydrolase family protein [Anaerolineaceae bacterium]|nr:fumarylacetoacetate hydrolase family protein [Anaerolineaceae bacterium]